MPVYQYACEEHGEFEKIKKIAERQSAICPECGKECGMVVTTPKLVKGGYMDQSMKFSRKV